MNHDETEMMEREFAARLGVPLEVFSARRAHCPPLQVLRAAGAEVLPAEQMRAVEDHLRDCAVCRTLAADLQSDELSLPTDVEAQRIRRHLTTRFRAKSRFALPELLPRAVLAAAAVAVLMWGGWMALQKPAAPTAPPRPQVAQQSPPQEPQITPTIPEALRLDMPEVRLRAAIVLVTRGGGDSQQYLQDLAPALEAYRAGNYESAATLFTALERRYPEEVELLFYGGVSQLHHGEHAAAAQSLERAQALGERDFADQVSWYLGLAYHRAGRLDAARAQFDKLCRSGSDVGARACDAASALR